MDVTLVTRHFMSMSFLCNVKNKFGEVFILLLILINQLSAQDTLKKETSNLNIGVSGCTFESSKSHQLNLNSRYFFMNTDNADLVGKDFYANGLNVELSYRNSNLFKLIQNDSHLKKRFNNQKLLFEMGYSQTFKLDTSNLNVGNRYEIGLFDIQNPEVRYFGILNLLNLTYINKYFKITAGRMLPINPFVNEQDGRLRPTYVQGLRAQYNWDSKTGYFRIVSNLSILNAILVRSTNSWKPINESLGIYPQGVSVLGKPAQYANHSSQFGSILYCPSLTLELPKLRSKTYSLPINIDYNALYLDKLMLTNMLKVEGKVSKHNSRFELGYGIMWIHQNFLIDTSGTSPETRYAEKNETSNVYSGQLSFNYIGKRVSQKLKVASTRITDDGRYLMPREWGRDPFYTFMPRERNEGLADVNAYTVNYSLSRKNNIAESLLKLIQFDLGYGYYQLPDVKNYLFNKYGMPSYQQLNAKFQLNFGLKLEKGKTIQNHDFNVAFWYIQKLNNGDTYNLLKYISNKVDMNQVNIVLNYNIQII